MRFPYVLATSLVVAVLLSPPAGKAAQYKLKTLHSFCSIGGCSDGEHPFSGVLRGPGGAIYGTTIGAGKYDGGVVFKLDADNYNESVLHNFCKRMDCTDGAAPQADLIMDVDGNLYGTNASGGNSIDSGVIFKLTHNGNLWMYSVLHTFCKDLQCNDGSKPTDRLSYSGQSAGTLWNGTSPLFGTTAEGGSANHGVVYEHVHDGSQWNFSVIHNFKSSSGYKPTVVDAGGNIFGTVQAGGLYSGGILYKLAQGTWHETVLHNFCKSANCADGDGPIGNLFLDADGNVFGTTRQGGTNNFGVVFEHKAGDDTSVLYNFCSQADCTDGSRPEGGVVANAAGDLFGTTSAGGDFGNGTIFEIRAQRLKESVLYSFCSKANCADGSMPGTSVTLDDAGDIFGTASNGGGNGDHGLVFELKPL